LRHFGCGRYSYEEPLPSEVNILRLRLIEPAIALFVCFPNLEYVTVNAEERKLIVELGLPTLSSLRGRLLRGRHMSACLLGPHEISIARMRFHVGLEPDVSFAHETDQEFALDFVSQKVSTHERDLWRLGFSFEKFERGFKV
jgi:hypothetical protein